MAFNVLVSNTDDHLRSRLPLGGRRMAVSAKPYDMNLAPSLIRASMFPRSMSLITLRRSTRCCRISGFWLNCPAKVIAGEVAPPSTAGKPPQQSPPLKDDIAFMADAFDIDDWRRRFAFAWLWHALGQRQSCVRTVKSGPRWKRPSARPPEGHAEKAFGHWQRVSLWITHCEGIDERG